MPAEGPGGGAAAESPDTTGTDDPGTRAAGGLGAPVRTVLVPGTVQAAAHAVQTLRDAGARPLVVPFVQTVPTTDLAPLDAALDDLAGGRFGWLALTSAAGVRALDDRARERRGDGLGALLGDTRVAAVGRATCDALAALGIAALVPGTGAGAAGLVGPLAAAARGGRVLVARGDLAAPTLVAGLREAGLEVHDVVVYRTVPAPAPSAAVREDWTTGRIDAVLLTSPSTARAVLDRLGPPPAGTTVACLGPTTAQAARELGLHVDVLSPTTTLPALVAALVDHWKDPA